MDLSMLSYDHEKKLITIEDITPRQTVEVVKELIKQNKIDPYGFQHAFLAYKKNKGPIFEIRESYSGAPYKSLSIHTINLKNFNKDAEDFTDAECAVEILKLLNLYVFESIEGILMDPENYINTDNSGYKINVDKNGSFIWENPYGTVVFMYD